MKSTAMKSLFELTLVLSIVIFIISMVGILASFVCYLFATGIVNEFSQYLFIGATLGAVLCICTTFLSVALILYYDKKIDSPETLASED